MPYDAVTHPEARDASAEPCLDCSDKTHIRIKNNGGIIAEVRAADRAMVASAKRAGTRGLLSAMMVAGAAFGAPQVADASIVTITITGTVSSGTDVSGVFGPPNTNLAGDPFTATFTFDDTKGTQSVCSSPPCYQSDIASTSTSNPGRAVLKIGSGQWSFGSSGVAPSNSIAQRGVPPEFNSVYFEVEGFYSGNVNTLGSAAIQIGLGAADNTPPLTLNYNWEASFTRETQITTTNDQFAVAAVIGGKNYTANGYFTATGITVDGPVANPVGPLSALNPYALYAASKLAPPILDLSTVLSSPAATALAADGESAVVLNYQSTSNVPVTFSVSASGNGLASGATAGTVAPFDPGYLVSPSPAAGSSQSLSVSPYNCDQFGNCTFLALLWGPAAMPNPDASPAVVNLTITATQLGAANPPTYAVELVPPPLLLVHGLWDDATSAWATPGTGGFFTWIYTQYPDPVNLVSAVDYGFGPPACLTCSPGEPLSAKEFDDPQIQSVFENSLDNAIATAANAGISARTVDVVAHSMGGLVTRYYMSNSGSSENPALLSNPIHTLITIGTPHLGTNLATVLENNQNKTTVLADLNPEVDAYCSLLQVCTAGTVFSLAGMPIDTAVASLEPESPQIAVLSPSTQYDAIVGESPTPISLTEVLLDALIIAFDPPQTVSSILEGQVNDVVVPVESQAPSCGSMCATVPDVVHTGLVSFDCNEKHSEIVWGQAFYWLTGGVGTAPLLSISIACNPTSVSGNPLIRPRVLAKGTVRANTLSDAGPSPNLNLTGYTQVAANNAEITPASGTTLTIGTAASITAISVSKTITEVLLFQSVLDPTDTVLAYATQSPFTISFTPTRLGTATFVAITVFNDNTFALTTLSYPLQTSGFPGQLTLTNAPAASLKIGVSTVVQASAQFVTGNPVNVTQVATYTTQSGTTNVFSVGPGGAITATGIGEDQLNVSYGGLTASAVISVGACTFSLNPSSQIVSYLGGTVSIGVIAPSGCAWTATGGGSWLTFTNASGLGSGTIMLTAAANTSGSAQSATVSLGKVSVLVEQPATSCTYSLSQTQINAPAAGTNGTIAVTTSCPVVASSNASWVTETASGLSVAYTVAPNTGTTQRTATLTIGAQTVPVVQPAAIPPTINNIAPFVTSAGGVEFTLTVNGTNFYSGATVNWDGTALTTTYVSPIQLTALVPATFIEAVGSAEVTVSSAGGTSLPVAFTIVPTGGLPLVLSLSPGGTTSGGAGFTLTVYGANFVSGSVVLWNGSVRTTTYVSSTELTAMILATDILSEGTNLVTVANREPNAATSAAQPFAVVSATPIPTITGASLADTADANGNYMLSLTGTDFVSGSTVEWNGTTLTTDYISPWQISATLPAADFGSAATVSVVNPSPGSTSAGFVVP